MVCWYRRFPKNLAGDGGRRTAAAGASGMGWEKKILTVKMAVVRKRKVVGPSLNEPQSGCSSELGTPFGSLRTCFFSGTVVLRSPCSTIACGNLRLGSHHYQEQKNFAYYFSCPTGLEAARGLWCLGYTVNN